MYLDQTFKFIIKQAGLWELLFLADLPFFHKTACFVLFAAHIRCSYIIFQSFFSNFHVLWGLSHPCYKLGPTHSSSVWWDKLYHSNSSGLEINFLTHLQKLASASKIYLTKWNHFCSNLDQNVAPDFQAMAYTPKSV